MNKCDPETGYHFFPVGREVCACDQQINKHERHACPICNQVHWVPRRIAVDPKSKSELDQGERAG